MSTVFIALQTNEDTRQIVDAILQDNPHAVVNEQPAMVKIDADDKLVGIITDRDICMAAMFQARPLQAIPVAPVSTILSVTLKAAPQQTHKLDAHRQYIVECLQAAHPAWLPATVLAREIAERGYTGVY